MEGETVDRPAQEKDLETPGTVAGVLYGEVNEV